jgi:hypothetical protein
MRGHKECGGASPTAGKHIVNELAPVSGGARLGLSGLGQMATGRPRLQDGPSGPSERERVVGWLGKGLG